MPSKVYWGCHDSPLGPLLVGVTDTGFCRLEFASGYGLTYDLSLWKSEWPQTEFIADSSVSASIATQFREFEPANLGAGALALYGTEFQLKMWKAMLQIPEGRSISYADITAMMKKPKGEKAAGIAASASLTTLVPCHRVVSADGAVSYRWGAAPKSGSN
jgi:AraC family transcriptional regulator of adaptative response/methylated-DNA-[protein]-cysteine methyltransferase